MKVVINACFGGFGLSDEACERLIALGMQGRIVPSPDSMFGSYYIENNSDPEFRCDPRLVRLVEEMGPAANGSFAKLKVVEIPDGVSWEIEDYDGSEHVAEKHSTWS
jgi:hypothetical protein